jgi:transcriptional regulator with XRE-family HTH domain
MKNIKLNKDAILLRKKGYSLKEIAERFNISKSTASLWLRDIQVSSAGLKRLKNISDIGRNKAAETNKRKKKVRWQEISDRSMIFKKNLSDCDIEKCKLLLAMLYWGEGAKTGSRLTFINSDPNMVKVYLFLLRKSFNIKIEKLKGVIHLHCYHKQNEMIDYWSKITKIDKKNLYFFKKQNSGKTIRENYKGCISLRYGDVNVFDEVMLIINRIYKAVE